MELKGRVSIIIREIPQDGNYDTVKNDNPAWNKRVENPRRNSVELY